MSEAPPQRMPPYRLLDVWRGLASLGVVGYHWGDLVVRRYPELDHHWLYHACKFGWLGVQIFFVISGFVIASAAVASQRKEGGLWQYTWARVRRIYPPYWAALVLNVLFLLGSQWLAAHGLVKENVFTNWNLLAFPLSFYLTNLTLTMSFVGGHSFIPVAWTLCYEIAFYMIIAVAMWLVGRLNRPALLLPLLHTLTAGCLLALIIAPASVPFPLNLWAQFGLGVALFDVLARPYGEAAARPTRWWAGALVALTLALVVSRDVLLGSAETPSRLQYAVTLAFTVYLFFAYRFDERWSARPILRVLATLGVFSYSLYLTHMMTIRVVSLAIMKLGLPVGWHYVLFAAALAVAVGAAYLFYLLFERPFIGSKRKPPVAPAEPMESPARPDITPPRTPPISIQEPTA